LNDRGGRKERRSGREEKIIGGEGRKTRGEKKENIVVEAGGNE